MASRTSSVTALPPAMPAVDGPDAHPAEDSTQVPGFMRNLDRAYERDPQAGFLRWARLKDRTGLDPEIELIAIADALPPAAMALATQWGPISTTTWQLNVLTDRPQSADGWWLLQANTLHAADGNSSQSMTIWNREGTAVATATQSVALFI